MSEPRAGAADSRLYDAEILAEVSSMLQDCACLHYALTELVGDPQEKAAAAQSSANFRVLSAQLRAYSVKLGAVSSIRDADRTVPSNRAPALHALAYADHANAFQHIALCDAEALRLVGQRCSVAGLSAETRGMLLMVHRALRESLLKRSTAKGPSRGLR